MVWVAQRSFGSGELSPAIFAIVDSSVFRSGCKTLANAILTRFGGARKRDGLGYVTDAHNTNFPTAIFPYRSQGKQYVVNVMSQDDDAGDLNTTNRLLRVIDATTRAFINFGSASASGPFAAFGDATAVHHHFTATELAELYSFQEGNRLFLLHPDKAPFYLERREVAGAEDWLFGIAGRLDRAPRVVSNAVDATVSEVGTDRLESSVPLFDVSDIGTYWRHSGRDQTTVPVTSLVYGVWVRADGFISPTRLISTRLYGLADSANNDPADWVGPYVNLGSTFTLQMVAGQTDSTTQNETRNWFTPSGGGLVLQRHDIGLPLLIENTLGGQELHLIVNVIAPQAGEASRFTTVRIEDAGGIIDADAAITDGGQRLQFNKGKPWAPNRHPIFTNNLGDVSTAHQLDSLEGLGTASNPINDQWLPPGHETNFDGDGSLSRGGSVFLNGGSMTVDGRTGSDVTDPTGWSYDGTNITPLAHLGPSLNYKLGQSPGVGFPRCGTGHQSRVFLGGFVGSPGKVVSTRTGALDDFTPGSLDDEGLEFEVNDSDGGRLSWMQGASDLLMGSDTREFAITGAPITPSNVGIEAQTGYGGSPVRPALVGNAVLFVDAIGKGLREMAFVFDRDGYLSPDLTDLASHLFESNVIKEIAYVSSPDQLVLVRHADNSISCLSFRRENGVVGWSPFVLPTYPTNSSGGTELSTVESMAAIRSDGVNILNDELWVVRKFTKGGANDAALTHRSIERMASGFTMDGEFVDDSPSSATLSSGGLQNTFSGSFQIIADAVYIGDGDTDALGRAANPLDLGSPPAQTKVGKQVRFELVPVIQEFTEPGRGDTQGREKEVSTALLLLRSSKGGLVESFKIGSQAVPETPATTVINALDGWQPVYAMGEHGRIPEINIVHTPPYAFEISGLNLDVSYGHAP